MKENFIEVTKDDEKVLINLLNVTKIRKAEDSDGTKISFDKSNFVTVNESYDEVKNLLGFSPKREARRIV